MKNLYHARNVTKTCSLKKFKEKRNSASAVTSFELRACPGVSTYICKLLVMVNNLRLRVKIAAPCSSASAKQRVSISLNYALVQAQRPS
jgi:hypothetical protein